MSALTIEELDRLCNEVLSALEIREARLLNWGFINGAQTLDNLDSQLPELLSFLPQNSPELAALWQRAQADGIDGTAILTNLLERRLVFKSGMRYRTRFAETIRSLFLLRQRFSPEDWQTGERLVGDLRILLQRRRYPLRNISADAVLAQLGELGLGELHQAAVRDLLREGVNQTLALARFQTQAITRIFRNLQSTDDSAVVIGAGTGAGKTKAFYIPALAHIAATLSEDHHVQALALYPRKELLKDQLRETYTEARKLDHLLESRGLRPIVVGAYYGDVPSDAADLLKRKRENWRRTRDRTGWLCPYITCPNCGEQSMAWIDADLDREAHDNQRGLFGRFARLICQRCGESIGPDRLMLTRRQMLRQPPDILFTTTEMLNRRLSNAAEHGLFGIGVDRPPRLLLTDEIHLNEGIHGAQVAYLLRRWRHARGRQHGQSLCIVGLSATVTQAETFFARLTGVAPQRVTYITPADADLVKEGMEYNVVLKGDPLSGTTLLSTSVRTAMLVCRIMDPLHDNVSHGAYGQRVFAFSDRLDVINRWYHIEKEVENPAEPYCRFLYVPASAPYERARYQQGQNWWFVPHIHGESVALTSGLRLDITSSQYAGVDNSAHLVIASSTLEVGYNDPTVGAIIQHKAPYSRAAFIQRKGRAGRPRTMRPWMVLITSAYGHDRWAFQHAESLFDPILPPLDLPLENYYVQKIQATFALMDWLALMLKRTGRTESVWDLLRSDERARDAGMELARRAMATYLEDLLQDASTLDEFQDYLQAALQLPKDHGYTANLLLWGEPRPLLLEVIPTLLRQLETYWQSATPLKDGLWEIEPWTDSVANRPLPDFVPAALFSDLKSPDLLIHIPEARPRPDEPLRIRAEETLSVALALSEFVPGKVNKRFARKDKIREAHWLELPEPLPADTGSIEIPALALQTDQTPTPITLGSTTFLVFCPRALTLACVPTNVRPTSTAHFSWQSSFTVRTRHGDSERGMQARETKMTGADPGIPIHLRVASPWASFLRSLTVYTHGNGTWVEITRLATGVRVSTRYEPGYERRGIYQFTVEEQPSALGFTVDSDALRVQCAPLNVANLRQGADWRRLYRSLSPQFFLHLLRTDDLAVALKLSELEIDWLWQVSMSMLVQTAIENHTTLAEAAAQVQSNYQVYAQRVLAIIFQNQPMDATTDAEEDEIEAVVTNVPQTEVTAVREHDSEDEIAEAGYLQSKLLDFLSNPSIQAMIAEHIRVLWEDDHPRMTDWLRNVYAFSLGAVVLTALLETTPDVQTDDLYLDVVEDSLWISEAAAGGVGLIARLADAVAQHPRRFDLQMAHAIQHCQRSDLAGYLSQVTTLLRSGDPELTQCFVELRKATDLPRIEDTRRALTAVLDKEGIPPTRQLSIALNTKFLRPNSDQDTDALIAELLHFWQTEQERLGCVIDLRMISVAATQDSTIQNLVQSVLARVGEGALADDANQVYNLLQSLLWLDCQDACPDCISRPQRYQSGPRPSRALLQQVLAPTETPAIWFGAADWDKHVQEQLAASAQVHVQCQHEELPACHAALLGLLAEPIDVGYQALYPEIEHVSREGRCWKVAIVLPELVES